MAELNGTETNGTKTNGIGAHIVLDGRIAISPNAPQDVPRLLKEVNALSQDLNEGNQEARLKLIDAAQSVVRALETPRETLLRYCWANSTAFAAIETCIDLGIFPILAQSAQSRSVTELAKATGAEPELLGWFIPTIYSKSNTCSSGSCRCRASPETPRCHGRGRGDRV